MTYGVQAVQITADGSIVAKRCLMKKMMAMHSGGADAVIKFYDLAAAPSGGESYYEFNAYGKGVFQVEMPDDGILFKNGVYVDLPADCNITVWFEEV